MIDIHTHILPGMDDGAVDILDTIEMARLAAMSGVTEIVATPHFNIPGLYDNAFGEHYVNTFNQAARAIKEEKIPIRLFPGMEAFFTEDLPRQMADGKVMTINQSHYILMEFAFDEDPDFATRLLGKVREVGAKPVIAHAERYYLCRMIRRLYISGGRRDMPFRSIREVFLDGLVSRQGRRHTACFVTIWYRLWQVMHTARWSGRLF